MGAWGMTPFESDDFGDSFDMVARPVSKIVFAQVERVINKAMRSGEPQEMWTAVGLVLWAFHTGTLMRGSQELDQLQAQAQELLVAIEQDHEWLSSWRQPAAFRRMLQEVTAHIEAMGDDSPLTPFNLNQYIQPQNHPRKRRR